MSSPTLADVVNTAPISQEDKDLLLEAIKKHGETDELMMLVQMKLAEAMNKIVDDFGQIQDPKIQAIHTQLSQDFEKQNHQSLMTAQRLAADAEDLLLDTQKYQQDLQTAIEETEKMSAGE
jgi:leucyl aminopeptidase (aminopeptidase T)